MASVTLKGKLTIPALILSISRISSTTMMKKIGSPWRTSYRTGAMYCLHHDLIASESVSAGSVLSSQLVRSINTEVAELVGAKESDMGMTAWPERHSPLPPCIGITTVTSTLAMILSVVTIASAIRFDATSYVFLLLGSPMKSEHRGRRSR